MPVWHEASKELRESGEIAMAGIILEQHPRRARLFMQWKGLEWPVMVDALDLLELSVVPVTLLIDERGVVRRIVPSRADAGEELERFAALEPATLAEPRRAATTDLKSLKKLARRGGAAELRAYARALSMWGGERRLDEAIETYAAAVEARPGDGQTHFELGVAYRQRHDSAHRLPGDFQAAVNQWSRSIEIDPNNYVWRRRIQQFGPRMSKPYPFYDWVDEARAAIVASGGTAVALPVEPRGAELAEPASEFGVAPDGITEPDPEGRILRDPGGYVRTEATVVPAVLRPGEPARIHVDFEPRARRRAHWNNEAEGLLVWVDPPEGWQVDARKIVLTNPPVEVSGEVRRVEFEVRGAEGATGEGRISGYALYYVCEGRRGACLYRRQDLAISLPRVVATEGSR